MEASKFTGLLHKQTLDFLLVPVPRQSSYKNFVWRILDLGAYDAEFYCVDVWDSVL